MKQTLIILIAILFIGCNPLIIAQNTPPDTSNVDSVEKVAVSSDLPANFNEFLGTATDTVMVAIEFGLTRVPTPECNIKNYISFEVAKRVRNQDRWKNSSSDVRVEYYIKVGDQWVKFNPGLVLRETIIKK